MLEEKQKEFKKILNSKKSIHYGLYKQYLIHLTTSQINSFKVLCHYNERLKLGYTFKLNYARPKNKKIFVVFLFDHQIKDINKAKKKIKKNIIYNCPIINSEKHALM